MAENMAATLVESTTVGGVAGKRGRAHRQRIGAYGLIAAMLVALLIAGVAMHDRRASSPAAPAIPRTVTIQQAHFLENNTITLPSAVEVESAPAVVTSAQQRFLEANTVTLPAAGPSSPYAEVMTPTLGHPR
jgi:hypothetical protein